MTFPAFMPARLAGARVLVLGDVMLDTFVYGQVNRISPEAPIPVLVSRSVSSMAGGAANVSANLAALSIGCTLIGVAGDDDEGGQLRTLLNGGSNPIRSLLVSDGLRPTTVKTRFIAGSQQMLRVDREQTGVIAPATEDAVLAAFEGELAGTHIVALSDYGKGVLTDRVITEALRLAAALGVAVVVDPKRTDFSIYRGAAYIKPNLGELERATGCSCATEEGLAAAVERVFAATGASVLLTRSQHGMSLFGAGKPAQHVRSLVKEVFDVSGAGDTALAAFAAALAGGYDAGVAMRISNAAAGIAVSRLGTAVVTADELSALLNGRGVFEPSARVLSAERAAALSKAWRQRGLKVGFTNGCFDILHAGHVAMLATAAAECDRLIVGLNTDASVTRLKGPSRPVQREASRAQVLASLDCVDAVVLFAQDTPHDLITQVSPDVLIKGADYKEGEVAGADFVKSYGGRVFLVPLVDGQSTTAAIARMMAGNSGKG